MHGVESSTKMMADIVHLGMAVVAAGDAVIGTGGHDLVEFDLAVLPTLLGMPGLQEPTATTTAVIVRFVRCHFNDVFLADHRFDDIAQVVCDRVAKALADDLAGILDREGDAKFFVPVGIDLQAPFPYPFSVILIDRRYFKVVLDVELFQPGPD